MEKTIPPQHTRKARLFQILLEIPRGKVVTYGELAKVLATSPRAVASMLASNRQQDLYPCFKAVASDGRVSGYNLGIDEKIRRLQDEGIEIRNGRISTEYFTKLLE